VERLALLKEDLVHLERTMSAALPTPDDHTA